MSMSSLVGKLRHYGIKGVFDFVKARLADKRWERFFHSNVRKYTAAPVPGVTIVADLSSQCSAAKVMRDLCASLRDAKIPFQAFDIGKKGAHSVDVSTLLTPPSEFQINKYTNLVEMLGSPVPDGIVRHRGRVVFWEFENGILDAYPPLIQRQGDILPMSDFNFEYLKREMNGRRPVHKILYPLRIDTSGVLGKSDCRRKFGLAADDFIVFYNFSYASGWNRKNAIGAVKAFAGAFRDVPDAKLVLKTAASRTHQDRAQQLCDCARECGVDGRVVFVDDFLSQEDVYNLTNACDVYLSLHRSEGFGLGIAEAMILGKAVVITGYSAPLEFCNDNNSIIVPYKMIPVDCSDVPWYSTAKLWADADVDAAALALRSLYDDAELRRRLGDSAKKSILTQFSIDEFKKSINAYLSIP